MLSNCCLAIYGPCALRQECEGGEQARLMSFFRELSVGGVARPVDTLLMAGLILYGAAPFDKAVKSQTRQLAFVFQVSYCSAPALPVTPCKLCHSAVPW